MFCLGAGAFGQEPPPADVKPDPAKQDDPADSTYSMDLDSLLNTKVNTASKFSEELSGAAAVMSVVSKDELRRFGGITLGEILERVAGINGTSAFTDTRMVAVRGDQTATDGGHILILINGRPCREVLEGGMISDLMESFPVGILERIEVIEGPGSVLYGSDAFAGMVNLITQKPDGKSYRLHTAAGPSAANATSLEVLYQAGDLSIVAAGQYHQMPQWDTLFRSFNTTTKLVSAEDTTLRNDGEGGYLGIDYKGLSFMSSYTGIEGPTFVGAIPGDMRWKRGFADLGYSLKASQKWEMTLNATYTRMVQDDPEFPNIHRDSYEGLVEWTNFYTFSDTDKLTFGALYSHIGGTESYTGVTPNEIVMHGTRSASGFYAQHEHRLTDSLKVVGGLQANKIGNIALNVVPRAGIVWNPAADFTLKALYGGAFRAPSLDELYLNDPGLKGDPNLKPEKVGTVDLQLSYQRNHVRASVGYFHSKQSDFIAFTSVYPSHVTQTSGVTFQGMQGEGKYYVRKNWFFLGSMLYQTNHNGVGVSNVTPVPNRSAKGGASYAAENGFEISLFDAYDGLIPGYAMSANPLPNGYQSISLHGRYDLSKHFLKTDATGFALFLEGQDLTNHQVWLPAWGSDTSQTIPVIRGRTLYIGIEVWQKHE
jgi:outer membrane receptor protein involved in Fe transport